MFGAVGLGAFGGEHLERIAVYPCVREAAVCFFEVCRIDVAERGDVHLGMRRRFAEVAKGLVTAPYRGVGEHFAGFSQFENRGEPACRKKRRRGACGAQERATAHGVFGF